MIVCVHQLGRATWDPELYKWVPVKRTNGDMILSAWCNSAMLDAPRYSVAGGTEENYAQMVVDEALKPDRWEGEVETPESDGPN